MTESKAKRGWLNPLFEPKVDFYELLEKQAKKTLEGMEALSQWISGGTEERCQRVRDLEHDADEMKLELGHQLVECFITPFDREDIYDLSLRMDEIINGAKTVVREIEAMEYKTKDSYLAEMAEVLVEGTRCLHRSFVNLKGNTTEASNQAYLSRKAENRFYKVYRQAMRALFHLDDVKEILKTHEVYRYMSHAADQLDKVGEKLLHVIIKIS